MRPAMHVFRNRLAIGVGVGCLMAVVIVVFGLGGRAPRTAVQDASYKFTFIKLTQGTNHMASSGIPGFGLLNRTLARQGRPRIGHSRLYSWTTPQPSTCLSIGFRHQGDVLKR